MPATLLVIVTTAIFELWLGSGFLQALGLGFLIGMAPQSGYAFGLLVRNILASSRSPLAHRSSRYVSVAMLYKQNSSSSISLNLWNGPPDYVSVDPVGLPEMVWRCAGHVR